MRTSPEDGDRAYFAFQALVRKMSTAKSATVGQPDPDRFDLIGIHSSEMLLKGKNRRFFERQLVRNLGIAARALGDRDTYQYMGKFFIAARPEDTAERFSEILSRVPGVETFFPAYELSHDIDRLERFIRDLASRREKKPFAVRCRRAYKQFPLDSQQINVRIGAALVADGWKVDLTHTECCFHIDVLRDRILVHTDIFKGPGGLPVGVSGKVVALLSGGIDSPVAARMLYNRGCRVIFVHFFNQTIDSCGVRDKIRMLVDTIQKYQPPTRLYMIPFAELQRAIIARCPSRQRMIMYRRVMFRIAQRIAEKEGALGMVTGDSIGQVASQTMENLRTIYAEASLPVFTPLIGMNKQQTVDFARRFGTYDISVLPYNDCCSFMVARHPETRSTLDQLDQIEAGADLAAVETDALGRAEIISV